jgi:hypothetical protein
MKASFLALVLAFAAHAAQAQSVSTCPTAAAGTVWAKGAWLPCSTSVAYIAQPVPSTTLASDMRCPISPATGACVFSWQLGPNVLPTDQVWVKTTALPNGTWVKASTLKFASGGPSPFADCITYLYTGTPFTSVSVTGPAAYGAPVTSPLSGSVTLNASLPANGTVTFSGNTSNPPATLSPDIYSWDFSSEGPGLKLPEGSDVQYSFSFTTSNGVIVKWNMSLRSDDGPGDSTTNIVMATSTQNGDVVTTREFQPGTPQEAETDVTGISTAPGTWTCQIILNQAF